MPAEAFRCCLVVPHFEHVDQFSRVLQRFVATGLPLIVVDDASASEEFSRLEQLLQQQAPQATLVKHSRNQGKGGSVMTGLRTADQKGFTHALQIDADGQHNTDSIPSLLQTARKHPQALVCGKPSFGDDISGMRYYSRYLTLYLCWLETLSREIQDALCGFRAYPLKTVLPVIDKSRPGRRMAFDPEILVRACWAGLPLRYIPVAVAYPQGGRSHFHYFRDNLEITWMHTRLLCGMLWRSPKLLFRKLKQSQEGA